MGTTHRSVTRIVAAGSLGVVLFWVIAFGAGWVSPVQGLIRLRRTVEHGDASGRSAGAPSFPWRYDDSVPPSSLDQLREAVGAFRLLLVVRAREGSTTASTRSFVRELGERHHRDGVTALFLSDGDTSPVLEALLLKERQIGTVLVDSVGRVRFAWRGIAQPDQLRQLVERAVWGRARNEPPTIPLEPSFWAARLRRAELDSLAGGPVGIGSLVTRYRYAVVFDAYCSRCRILRHLADLMTVVDSLTSGAGTGIAAIVPEHYLSAVARATLDSIPVDWFVARRTIAPELAMVTRDIPQAAPLLLELEPRLVVRSVTQIAARSRP